MAISVSDVLNNYLTLLKIDVNDEEKVENKAVRRLSEFFGNRMENIRVENCKKYLLQNAMEIDLLLRACKTMNVELLSDTIASGSDLMAVEKAIKAIEQAFEEIK
jgi:uncharacterized membrane-anchored protein